MKVKIEHNKILIIGAVGGLAQITIERLIIKYPFMQIIAIDNRPIKYKYPHPNITYLELHYTRNDFEQLFRNHRFDAVYHLGRMSHVHSTVKNQLAKRLNLNVMGTNRILELAMKHQTKKIIVLSTYHVYGALPDNPVYVKEDAVLRASIKYPELRDVVEMDQICTNWMWKNQNNVEMVVLRPCSIIGSKIKNAMRTYLTTDWTPEAIDFNPMFQFINEQDMGNILMRSFEELPSGIYNVAPDDLISLKDARSLLNTKSIQMPLFVVEPMMKLINKTTWTLPMYLIDYLKYACIIDNTELKKHLGEKTFDHGIRSTLASLKDDKIRV